MKIVIKKLTIPIALAVLVFSKMYAGTEEETKKIVEANI
jgi:hypothetical protein